MARSCYHNHPGSNPISLLLNRYRSKRKAFDRYLAKRKEDTTDAHFNAEKERIKKYCTVVRVLAHTQTKKINLRQKKAHLMEIQVNGGSVAAKVDWAVELFERKVPVDTVFSQNDMIDTISVTHGKGVKGVINRFGTRKLQRKTHRGNRKVYTRHPINSITYTVISNNRCEDEFYSYH